MAFAVARTRDEAQLYLELHPCPDCGSIDAPWEQALIEVDGELTSSYAAICPGCNAHREYLFGLPVRETPVRGWPTFGGPEPSEVLDAGQWLDVADSAASEVPADPGEAGKVLAVARAAVDEVIKFVPAGRRRRTAGWVLDARGSCRPGRGAGAVPAGAVADCT